MKFLPVIKELHTFEPSNNSVETAADLIQDLKLFLNEQGLQYTDIRSTNVPNELVVNLPAGDSFIIRLFDHAVIAVARSAFPLTADKPALMVVNAGMLEGLFYAPDAPTSVSAATPAGSASATPTNTSTAPADK